MDGWIVNGDGTVTLYFEQGEVVVKETDFNRAFGAMINGGYENVLRDFGLNK